jgi:hypothetical protein
MSTSPMGANKPFTNRVRIRDPNGIVAAQFIEEPCVATGAAVIGSVAGRTVNASNTEIEGIAAYRTVPPDVRSMCVGLITTLSCGSHVPQSHPFVPHRK